MEKQRKYFKKRAVDFVDEKIYQSLNGDLLERLIDKFFESINSDKQIFEGFSNAKIAWCRFIFVMIVFGGIAAPDVMTIFLYFQYQDLNSTIKNYIQIPRAGGHYPIYLPDIASIFALSYCVYLDRKCGPGRNRIGRFPCNAYILPDRDNPILKPSDDELSYYQDLFRKWLGILGKSAGFYLPIGRFLALAQASIVQVYTPPIAAALFGVHVLNPALVEQKDSLSSYRAELQWDKVLI